MRCRCVVHCVPGQRFHIERGLILGTSQDKLSHWPPRLAPQHTLQFVPLSRHDFFHTYKELHQTEIRLKARKPITNRTFFWHSPSVFSPGLTGLPFFNHIYEPNGCQVSGSKRAVSIAKFHVSPSQIMILHGHVYENL